MDKIYKLVEQSVSELESMGLEFKPYVTYESYDPSFAALFHAGENLVLILSVDMIRTEFFVLPKGDIILFLIDVLQETDLTQYLNMLGSSLFYDVKQSILDKYDQDDDPDMKPLIDVLNDSTNLEFKGISRWNNGDIHRIHYSVD
jgi:hypothetical protein